MRYGLQRTAATAAAVGLIVVGATGALAADPSAPPTPTQGAPDTVALRDGSTFTLSKRVADKIKNKEPLNIYMSFQTIGEPGAPALLTAGLEQAAKEATEKYGIPISTKLIGPVLTNPAEQISQIQQLVESGQLDCVGIEPVTPDAFLSVINDTMAAGVPVMTVNTDSPDSQRFAYYGVNDVDLEAPNHVGEIAGEFTVDWAKANGIDLKKAALITGDTTAPWAQGRMQGWMDTVTAAIPELEVVGTPTNAFTTGYEPEKITVAMQSFMTGHPDVQFYFSSDWEGRDIGKLIGDMGLKDQVYALGYNVDQTMLNDLDEGLLVGTVDQRYDLQSKTFLLGCADLLLGGVVPSEWQYLTPTIWTPETAAEAREFYEELGAL